jgi:carboxymethylenebutenolidase
MTRSDIKIGSSQGGAFDGYLVTPDTSEKVPAIVLASAVHGVDADLRALADEFAGHGYIAVAPDLFWRSIPGPLGRDDKRTQERSQPREQKIKDGEIDVKDVAAYARSLPQSNGRVAIIGFCYGGPYAILGPKRLGYDAGIGCHSSLMGVYVKELAGVTQPVCLMWGDQDHAAPAEVLDAYRAAATHTPNLELHIFPGILHGYMMKGGAKAFDQKTFDFSMSRTLAILEGLRGDDKRAALRRAS